MHDTWLIITTSYFGLTKPEKMAEEFQKYKDILAREQNEFKEEMKREVSASVSSQLSKEKQNLQHV